ncbi:MAG: substrate-binding domain-containing protein [Sedimentisphaerales bacterium]|nr:substrate-binding domain-containing protein [Sedimentisphaerales bacterium]
MPNEFSQNEPISGMRRNSYSVFRFLDNHRALLLLLLLFVGFSVCVPNFFSAYNITTILKGASLNAIVSIGFTLIFILGQLDLSVGAVVMLSGMVSIGLQPLLGWTISIVLALLTGAFVGCINGLLVVKGKINSFIVTLGTMIIVTGVMHLYSKGGSMAVEDYRLADWLETPLLPLLPPIVLLTLLLVLGCTIFLNRTPWGRAFFIVGGNPESAWLAGLGRDRYLMAGFIGCGLTAGLAGAIFAAGLSSMTSAAVLANRTLMTVLVAVIMGGALMSGGKGCVLKSYFAVLLLTTLFNGIGCVGLGFEVQIFINGILLALVVLYEAFVLYQRERIKGQRSALLMETIKGSVSDRNEEGVESMTDKDRFVLMCVAIVGIVAIVAIFAMYFIHVRIPVRVLSKPQEKEQSEFTPYALRGTDGQPYILPQKEVKNVPDRPADPKALPETEKGHWWDIEYAGWNIQKVAMPSSPGDGPAGKRIVLLKAGDHPYWTAYVKGFTVMAQAYKMETKILNGNWNMDLQAQQTDQAINERPDMVIFAPVDATACTPLLRRITKAGIPCIASNTIPCDEAMKYCLAWTGPDDWGQFRLLAREFADAMGKKGGYAIVRHMPGSSPFFARTYAPITELMEYAPKMKLLAMDTANLEAEGTMQLVSAWLTLYGDQLQGLVLAGDGFTMTGTLEAIRSSQRKDIVIVAAGNSKTGMDAVKAGDALAITYQSAEGDGAIAVYTAAEWFDGNTLPLVRYLPKQIITQANVDQFMPAQW